MFDDATRRTLAPALARAFLAGEWTEDGLRRRARQSLSGTRARWPVVVAAAVLAAYRDPPRDWLRELTAFVDVVLGDVPERRRTVPPKVREHALPVAEMAEPRWPVPRFDGVADLAHWLDVDLGELDWFADPHGRNRLAPREPLRHYRYTWVPRRIGPPRLLEAPKPRLKKIQRRILHRILDVVPAHDAAHGFVRGRSAITHARRHVGAPVLVALDLQDFFASVAAARVFGIFRAMGYPEAVAHLLTGLCTTRTPPAVRRAATEPLRSRLDVPHLPQGAPTSPALANLAAWALDVRLAGLASACGATYGRYADDLAFSGDLHRGAPRLLGTAERIARDEGFVLHRAKTRFVTAAGRQKVTGVVVNVRPNAPRAEYDALKALLHDARLHGVVTANRDGVGDLRAHVLGRISWVGALNPDRGARLRTWFDAVDWTA